MTFSAINIAYCKIGVITKFLLLFKKRIYTVEQFTDKWWEICTYKKFNNNIYLIDTTSTTNPIKWMK